MLSKYRVVGEEWVTAFGEKRITPAVQVRVGLFWWVTLTRCEKSKVMNNYLFMLCMRCGG